MVVNMYKNNTQSRIFFLIPTLLIVLFLLAGCTIQEKQATSQPSFEPVKIAYKPTAHYLSVFVAKDQGFFRQEGLIPELIEFDTSNLAMDALLTDQVDVARGGLMLQLKIESEKPSLITTFLVNKQTTENFVDYILVQKDGPVNSFADLKGKKVGTAAGLIETTMLKNILKAEGVAESDVQVIEMKPILLPQALEAKQIDAVFIYEPEANIALERGFARVLAEHPVETTILNPWIGGGVYIKTSFIESNPQKAKKIMRAFKKAGQFIADHPGQAKEILLKNVPLKVDKTKLHALAEFDVTDPEIIKAAQMHADFLFEKGVLKKRVDVGDLLYDQPIG